VISRPRLTVVIKVYREHGRLYGSFSFMPFWHPDTTCASHHIRPYTTAEPTYWAHHVTEHITSASIHWKYGQDELVLWQNIQTLYLWVVTHLTT